jgi:hypothetical protein
MDPIKPYNITFGSESLKLKLGNLALSCYILENGQRVLTKTSVQKALGYDGKSENWLFEFLMHINRLTPVEPVILEALSKDAVFQINNAEITATKYGVSANLFVEACNAIIKAKEDGFLFISELKYAKSAETIIKAIGDADIEKLIDYASGFDLFRQNHKEALMRFMITNYNKEYPVWIKSFPNNFIEAILAFKSWNWKELNENAEKIGAYFNHILFSRVEDVIFENLESSKPKMKYRKKNTPEQYIEHPDLKAQIQAITALIRASGKNQTIFEQLINKSFPNKRDLMADASQKQENTDKSSAKLSVFNETLGKALAYRKK